MGWVVTSLVSSERFVIETGRVCRPFGQPISGISLWLSTGNTVIILDSTLGLTYVEGEGDDEGEGTG